MTFVAKQQLYRQPMYEIFIPYSVLQTNERTE